MKLQHIPLSSLSVSTANARHARKAPDVTDLLPSIRARGILQPLLVRKAEDGYEVVAGRRRYFALRTIASEEDQPFEEVSVPCAVMNCGETADAAEASLVENVTHLPMEAMVQYEAFVRLERAGRTVADIAATFGIGEQLVRRRLALGTLDPKIRAAVKAGDIEPETAQLLTMASKRQQKEWLGLFEAQADETAHWDSAPRGEALRLWILGGEKVVLAHSRFDVARYAGPTSADLFGEEVYALDSEAFWTLQDEAIAALADRYREEGWERVTVLARGARFSPWQFSKVEKPDGGAVFIEVRETGEAVAHEGYCEPKAAKRRLRAAAKAIGGDTVKATDMPELSAVAERYLALHRHAMVRAALLEHPGVALRLAVAHLLCGGPLWSVRTEQQLAEKKSIVESVRASKAEQAFRAAGAEARQTLDLAEDGGESIVRHHGDDWRGVAVFMRLVSLSDEEVLRVLAVAIGETMAAGSAFVDAAGHAVGIDPAAWWSPDPCFLDLIRDRAAIDGMLAEVAGKKVARGNVSEKTGVKKRIIADCLAGEGREKVEGWVPRYLAFPPQAYTPRGTRAMASFERIAGLVA